MFRYNRTLMEFCTQFSACRKCAFAREKWCFWCIVEGFDTRRLQGFESLLQKALERPRNASIAKQLPYVLEQLRRGKYVVNSSRTVSTRVHIECMEIVPSENAIPRSDTPPLLVFLCGHASACAVNGACTRRPSGGRFFCAAECGRGEGGVDCRGSTH